MPNLNDYNKELLKEAKELLYELSLERQKLQQAHMEFRQSFSEPYFQRIDIKAIRATLERIEEKIDFIAPEFTKQERVYNQLQTKITGF